VTEVIEAAGFDTALPPGGNPTAYHGSTGVDVEMATGSIPPPPATPYPYDLFGVYLYMFCAAVSP